MKNVTKALLGGATVSTLALAYYMAAFGAPAFTSPTGGASVGVPASPPVAQEYSGDTKVSGGMKTAAVAAPGTGYVAGVDTEQLIDGGSVHGLLAITDTQVVSATVAVAGSGGTNGATTCTGTTGTGTPFQVTLTVANNGLAGALVVSVNGDYTANPTLITAEPVTCLPAVTGGKVSVVMGALTATITIPGVVTATPANPVAGTAVAGVGTGATWTSTANYGPIAQTLFSGQHPVNGWKVCIPGSTGDMWVTDNSVTPTANGPSSYRAIANGGCVYTTAGEMPVASSVVQVLGDAIGKNIVGRYW